MKVVMYYRATSPYTALKKYGYVRAVKVTFGETIMDSEGTSV